MLFFLILCCLLMAYMLKNFWFAEIDGTVQVGKTRTAWQRGKTPGKHRQCPSCRSTSRYDCGVAHQWTPRSTWYGYERGLLGPERLLDAIVPDIALIPLVVSGLGHKVHCGCKILLFYELLYTTNQKQRRRLLKINLLATVDILKIDEKMYWVSNLG